MESFTNEGLTFEVTDSGPADGRTVIALHGFPEDRHCWRGLAGHLAGSGHRVVAFDQRGYSPGASPAGRRPYRIEHLTADVLALADQAGSPTFDVVGHDWGAVIAWQLAAAHPERVRTLTVLSVPHPRAFRKAMVTSTQVLHSWYMAFFQLPRLPERVLGVRGGRMLADSLVSSGLDRATAERYAARAATPGALTGPINWYRGLPFGARDLPGPVSVPTLYVWGSRDRFVTPAAARRCGEYVTGPYRFVDLEGQTHWLHIEGAGQIALLVLEHLRTSVS
ncbi:MAG TPA: alpha/beta fold hydrolase [Acidimicrobiales bacterium]|nr:alpha/beta fold hydrolase [Acidimicrobiales bacterium]